MPELPEVETVCRGLRPFMKDKVLSNIICNRQNLRTSLPLLLAQRLDQQLVKEIFRRGKYIVIKLNDYSWIIHLGMSGRIQRSLVTEYIQQKHDHVVWQVDNVIFAFNDARRFGSMALVLNGASYTPFKNMAPEPFEISVDDFYQRMQQTSRPLKTSLLDQSIIAGLGNIYVCEALWKSRLSPFKPSNTIEVKQTQVLLQNIIETLKLAIDAGGSSLRDHRTVDGNLGYFQQQFKVYDRKAMACLAPSCCGTIKREVQSGRSTFYCDICQSHL